MHRHQKGGREKKETRGIKDRVLVRGKWGREKKPNRQEERKRERALSATLSGSDRSKSNICRPIYITSWCFVLHSSLCHARDFPSLLNRHLLILINSMHYNTTKPKRNEKRQSWQKEEKEEEEDKKKRNIKPYKIEPKNPGWLCQKSVAKYLFLLLHSLMLHTALQCRWYINFGKVKLLQNSKPLAIKLSILDESVTS